MLEVSQDSIRRQTDLCAKVLENYKEPAVFQKDFFERVFPRIATMGKFAEEYEVRIPKSLQALAAGDFEPAYTFKVRQPLTTDYSVCWFGDAADGVALHGLGYVRGDKRYITETELGGTESHMVLGGKTGAGKSVTVNSIILTLCQEYPPWELNLTMCDAKIVEFKNYALNYNLPQISSIAATGDADYLISVIDSKVNEMNLVNSAFAAVGVKKLSDYREALTKRENGKIVSYMPVPANLIIIDEFQSMFDNAGKKLDHLNKQIAELARKGRNIGYRLLLASQSLDSNVSKNLHNINVRASMGNTEENSNSIIGNDAAATELPKQGWVVVNQEPSKRNNREFNVVYKVPFAPNDQIAKISSDLMALAKELGYRSSFDFYDETDCIARKDFSNWVRSFRADPNRVILGEPSFVMEGGEKIVSLNFTGKDIENVCVFANSGQNLKRWFCVLKDNVELLGELNSSLMNVVINCDSLYEEEGSKALATKNISRQVGSDGKVHTVESRLFYDNSSYEHNTGFTLAKSLVSRRKLLLEVDKRARESEVYTEKSDGIFKALGLAKEMDTRLNRARCYYAISCLSSDDSFRKDFLPPGTKGLPEELLKKILRNLFAMVKSYGLDGVYTTVELLPKAFVWVLGLNKILGLGRDPKTKFIDELKKTLFDCSTVGVRFLIFTNDVNGDTKPLLHGIRWFVLEGIDSKGVNNVGASDFYPPEVSSVQGVLFDKLDAEEKCRKFKKMVFEGEIT